MIVDYSAITGPALVLGVLAGALAVFSIIAVVRSQLRRPASGREAFVGGTAVAQTRLDPDGTVLFEGELWSARAPKAAVATGDEVVVTGLRGLTLIVEKKEAIDD